MAVDSGTSKGTRLLIWISGLGLLITALVVIAVVVLWDPDSQSVSEESWLTLKLAGPLEDGPPEDSFLLDPDQAPLTVTNIAIALRSAAKDDDIDGLYLELAGPGLGLAGAQELRSAINDFTAAGKPCRAWAKSYDNIAWYLASACPEIHLHPEGVPLVIGLSMSITYMTGLFEKVGIEADYVWVGEYKSAVETYLRQGPSEPAARMYEEMLDSLYATFTGDAARGWAVPTAAVDGSGEALVDGTLKGLGEPIVTADEADEDRAWASRWSLEDVHTLINDPPMTAKAALERGLVDALSYKDEIDDWLEEVSGGEQVGIRSYYGSLKRIPGSRKLVAVLHLQGSIIDGRSSSGGFSGSAIGDRTVVKYLEELREDEEVAAVVLRLDSPGGSALASDVIWREVVKTNEVKPVVASMASYAASGGYYIAMGARHIVAEPATLTGSIGVFGGKFALGGLYEKLGLTTWGTQRGELAGLNDATRPWNDAERERITARMEDFYTGFVTKAAESRGVSFEELDAVARGRVWTGAQALEIGLVDQLGGLDEAVAVAAGAAALGDDYGMTLLPRPGTLMEALLDFSAPEDSEARAEAILASELLTPELAATLGRARLLNELLSAEGIVAAMPVIPEVR